MQAGGQTINTPCPGLEEKEEEKEKELTPEELEKQKKDKLKKAWKER